MAPSDELKIDFALAASGGDMSRLGNILAAWPDATHWNDVMGGTALRKAIAHGSPHIDAVKLLIDKGADINARDEAGMSPLMFAAMHGALDVLNLLLSLDARTDFTDGKGRNAAEIAFDLDRSEAAGMILAHDQKKRDLAEAEHRRVVDAVVARTRNGLEGEIRPAKRFVVKAGGR
jgi:ankyrin repeat protein